MNVNASQNAVQMAGSPAEVKTMPGESLNGKMDNNGFQKLFSLSLSQAANTGVNTGSNGASGTDKGVVKNPLLQLLQPAEIDDNGALPTDSEDQIVSQEKTVSGDGVETGTAILEELQGALTAMISGGQNRGRYESADESSQGSKPELNLGKIHLVEKLQESSQSSVYDTGIWNEKPVQEIMKEIKTNRQIAKETVTQTSNVPGEITAVKPQKPLPGFVEPAENLVATRGLNQESGISLEGFDPISPLEAANFADVMKEKILKNPAKQTEGETTQASQYAVQAANKTDQTNATGNIPAEVEKFDPASQISTEILSKLEQKGPMEFKMRLQPENLGNIDVQLKVSEGKLIIDITAANPKTQSLLAGQVDRLIANLGLQNVLVENIQIGQPSQVSQTNSGNQPTQTVQGISEQLFAMNAGMNFSHRGNQNQMAGQEQKSGRETLKDDQIQGVQIVENSRMIRNLTQKMDYAI